MPSAHEIDQNFEYFQGVVSGLLAEHAGQFALLRDRSIDSYFPTAVAALTAGYQKFTDGQFSVQEVTNTPLDLGFYSHVANLGPTRE